MGCLLPCPLKSKSTWIMRFYFNILPSYSVPYSYPIPFIWEFLSMETDRNGFFLFPLLCTYVNQAA